MDQKFKGFLFFLFASIGILKDLLEIMDFAYYASFSRAVFGIILGFGYWNIDIMPRTRIWNLSLLISPCGDINKAYFRSKKVMDTS